MAVPVQHELDRARLEQQGTVQEKELELKNIDLEKQKLEQQERFERQKKNLQIVLAVLAFLRLTNSLTSLYYKLFYLQLVMCY